MRELGVQGVRRGRTPVTTKPAKGTGGRPDLVERKFKASAPNRLHVADTTYVRMAGGRFGYTAFVTDTFARRIVGWACATSMDTEELPLQAFLAIRHWPNGPRRPRPRRAAGRLAPAACHPILVRSPSAWFPWG